METYAYKQMFYSYKTIKALITRKKEFKADDNYVINTNKERWYTKK
mgnify:FL=1